MRQALWANIWCAVLAGWAAVALTQVADACAREGRWVYPEVLLSHLPKKWIIPKKLIL
jgi:hypothetical protein